MVGSRQYGFQRRYIYERNPFARAPFVGVMRERKGFFCIFWGRFSGMEKVR
ncbi:hypothetical protein HMPREF6485_1613 [Segatella buccae ATCC 33574]|uniref:Uncharacterized protein n=1 Tax=Segatella buccae ATCC 33574 TaxID=873513 RepID=E6K833_9BACT|nr:hypothetical protein HMPREF6485_1613 [Segatella buccae ATCC 33574]